MKNTPGKIASKSNGGNGRHGDDSHGERLGKIEVQLSDHGQRLGKIEVQLSDHGQRLGKIEVKLENHGDRLVRIEEKLESHGQRLVQIEERLTNIEEKLISHGDRLARIEEKLENMPTRADLEAAMKRMLFWFVGLLMGVIGILGGAVIALVVALFRFLAAA